MNIFFYIFIDVIKIISPTFESNEALYNTIVDDTDEDVFASFPTQNPTSSAGDDNGRVQFSHWYEFPAKVSGLSPDGSNWIKPGYSWPSTWRLVDSDSVDGDNNDIETGCSVHWVTEDVDCGPVLAQRKVPVLANDDANSLKSRVQAQEFLCYLDALSSIS